MLANANKPTQYYIASIAVSLNMIRIILKCPQLHLVFSTQYWTDLNTPNTGNKNLSFCFT
jgi:hypothetical protein